MACDVFISYKESEIDNPGKKTKDHEKAKELHEKLSEAGIDSFFSDASLRAQGVSKYKQKINDEILSCRIMVVVGTSIENIRSEWVKYEWSTYHERRVLKNKGALFTYFDGSMNRDSDDFPNELYSVENQPIGEEGLENLVEFIKNYLKDCRKTDAEEQREEKQALKEEISSDENSAYTKPYLVSKPYLLEETETYADKSEEEIKNILEKMSAVYNFITEIKDSRGKVSDGDFFGNIYSFIEENARTEYQKKRLMKIKGPIGCYKNLFIQFLYLYIMKKNPDIIPFYINASMYSSEDIEEKKPEAAGDDTNTGNEKKPEDVFDDIEKNISSKPGQQVLIIIGGIKDYKEMPVIKKIKTKIAELQKIRSSCSVIVVIDSDFSNRKARKTIREVSTDYSHFVRIKSGSVEKSGLRDYIECLTEAFGKDIVDEGKEVNVEDILSYIEKLEIKNHDPAWLCRVIKTYSNLNEEGFRLSDVYHSLCSDILEKSSVALRDAAESAYLYEYGEKPENEEKNIVLIKHRKMLDYLIAYHYNKKLSELDVNDENKLLNIQLPFFSVILPESVLRFLNDIFIRDNNDTAEEKVFEIAEKYWDKIDNILVKNQLVCLIGRTRSPERRERAIELLKKFKEEMYRVYKEIAAGKNYNSERRKNYSLLLRSVIINLQLAGCNDDPSAYFDMLIRDKISNVVNRTFQLVYYGDITIIPGQTEIKDDLSVGKRAIGELCASVRDKLEKLNDPRNENIPAEARSALKYGLLLDIFNLCSLIQARMECADAGNVLNVAPYVEKIKELLRDVERTTRNFLGNYGDLKEYLLWMKEEFRNRYYADGKKFKEECFLDICNYKSNKKKIKDLSVGYKENMVESMYNSWLIAALYLPEKGEENENYIKQKVMNILLIKNMADACIDTGSYDKEKIMQNIIFSGTYPNKIDTTFLLEYWNSCCRDDDINLKIAKDIEIIQSLWQLKKRKLDAEDKDDCSDEDGEELRDRISTETGERMARKILGCN